MSNSVNVIVLEGGVVKVPDLMYSSDGLAYANFPLAVSSMSYKNGEKNEEVSYFDVVAFGKLAEICGTYLKKGTKVILSGKLKQNRWKTKEGTTQSRIKIIAQEVKFLPSGRRDAETKPYAKSYPDGAPSGQSAPRPANRQTGGQ